MKGFAVPTIILFLIAGIILIYAGGFLVGKAALFPASVTVDGQTCELKESNGFALIPLYAQYECRMYPSYGYQSKDASFWYVQSYFLNKEYQTRVGCPFESTSSVISPTCEVYIAPKQYRSDGEFSYRVCSSSGSCPSTWTSFTPSSYETTLRQIMKGQILEIKIITTLGWDANQYYRAYEKHKTYALFHWERGVSSETPLITTSCDIPWQDKNKLCISCVITDLMVQMGVQAPPTISNNPKGSLGPDERATYVKDWVYGPLSANFFQDPLGGWVDCSRASDGIAKLYNLGTIKTGQGCAAFPASVKGTVTCCPQETNLEGASCQLDTSNPNGKWVYKDLGCIKMGIPSILNCEGQGGYSVVAGTTKYKKATQCTSDGKCVYQEITAPCTPPANGCPPNARCMVPDPTNPMKNYCEGGILPCGDGNKDCYDDCTYEKLSDACDINKTKDCYKNCEIDHPIDLFHIGNLITQNTCKLGCWWKSIVAYLYVVLASLIISSIVVSIIRFVPLPGPLNIIRNIMMNPVIMVIAIIILTIILAGIFSIPVSMATAGLFGGG